MRRAVNYWEQNQITWYLEIIIHAINADHEINPTELDFFSSALKLISDHDERKRLLGLLESETTELKPAPGLSQEELAWVLTQVALLLISDYSFTQEESDILAEFSHTFGFSDAFFTLVMDWCNQGLEWKKKQVELIEGEYKASAEIPPDVAVPIYIMDQDQLIWYAKVLVTMIVIDGVVDQEEVDLFKKVIVFVKDKAEMAQLLTCLKKKTKPTLHRPPKTSEGILKRIFISAITHFSFNEQFDENEKTFIKQLAGACEFSHQFMTEATDFWDDGKNWVHQGEKLISRVND